MIVGYRKLATTFFGFTLLSVLPLIFKHNGISDEITMVVIGCIAASVGSHNIANAMSKGKDATPQ